jgi:hypothetical protein
MGQSSGSRVALENLGNTSSVHFFLFFDSGQVRQEKVLWMDVPLQNILNPLPCRWWRDLWF